MVRKILVLVVLMFFSAVPNIYSMRKEAKIGCEIGNIAPEFSLKDIYGREVSSKSCSGKVVYMVFWSLG
jgi:hypothetical protein